MELSTLSTIEDSRIQNRKCLVCKAVLKPINGHSELKVTPTVTSPPSLWREKRDEIAPKDTAKGEISF